MLGVLVTFNHMEQNKKHYEQVKLISARMLGKGWGSSGKLKRTIENDKNNYELLTSSSPHLMEIVIEEL